MPPRLRLRLRPTIFGWFSSLLVLTVASIGAFAYYETRQVLDFLSAQHLTSVAHGTRAEVQHLLTPAPRILTELALLAEQGALPEDERALGMVFVERMRQNPELGWLGYANDADRSFIGGTRSEHHGLRWYRTDPEVNGGISTEYSVDAHHVWTLEDSASLDPYDPTTRPWYRAALDEPSLSWLEPYEFTNGQWGMSLTRGVVRDGEVVGVLLADYFLEDITTFLETVEVGETGRVELVTAEGTVIGDTETHVADALLAMPRQGVHVIDVLGEPHRVVWEPLEVEGGLKWSIAIMVPEAELSGLARDNLSRSLQVGGLALLAAMLLSSWFASAVSRPIRQMSATMERLARLDIPEEPPPASPFDEIHTMSQSMASMEAGLASFARYVPVDLVRILLDRGVAARLGAEPRPLTLLFSDIADFTPMVESTPPEVVVEALGAYLQAMNQAVTNHGGVVSQYTGDGLLAYWGAPIADSEHELRACLGALAMRDASRALEKLAADNATPRLRTRFGLNTGDVLVGNIGAPERFNYSALGDAVNTAARIEGLNKVYGTDILVGEATARRVGDHILVRPIDRVRMKGKALAMTVFELMGEVDAVSDETRTIVARYAEALSDYQARRFERALQCFRAIDDPPSRVMVRRCEAFLAAPPPPDWDGIAVIRTK
jgi:adenylate cyclase